MQTSNTGRQARSEPVERRCSCSSWAGHRPALSSEFRVHIDPLSSLSHIPRHVGGHMVLYDGRRNTTPVQSVWWELVVQPTGHSPFWCGFIQSWASLLAAIDPPHLGWTFRYRRLITAHSDQCSHARGVAGYPKFPVRMRELSAITVLTSRHPRFQHSTLPL